MRDDPDRSYGIIKDIDLDISEEEICKTSSCKYEIFNVRRMKRRMESGGWGPSEGVRICFKSNKLPKYVVAFSCRIKVEPFIFAVHQCSNVGSMVT